MHVQAQQFSKEWLAGCHAHEARDEDTNKDAASEVASEDDTFDMHARPSVNFVDVPSSRERDQRARSRRSQMRGGARDSLGAGRESGRMSRASRNMRLPSSIRSRQPTLSVRLHAYSHQALWIKFVTAAAF